ncbi:MAG: ketoacyl reductase, partial [Bacilli bacterium]|nr:ketoacyl reductase [Bacilli bacterium]
GFLSGPLMATYYATKGYILKLTEAIYEELRQEGSEVYIGALCPGPVNTNFNNVAGVKFSVKAMDSYAVSEYAINQMFKRKIIIIPGILIKLSVFMTRLLPRKLLLKINYNIQRQKSE